MTGRGHNNRYTSQYLPLLCLMYPCHFVSFLSAFCALQTILIWERVCEFCLSEFGSPRLTLYFLNSSILLQISLFARDGSNFIVYIHHVFIIHSSVGGHIGWFHLLAIVTRAVNKHGCASILVALIVLSGSNGSCVKNTYYFLGVLSWGKV